MTVLVTGASGQVGRQVVAALVAAGVPVRAMTRRPEAFAADGVEVARGDLLEPASLPLSGVRALFLIPEPRTPGAVVAAAVAAGVGRIVTLSSGAVTSGLDTDFHLPVERAVEASGREWTHLRPGEFAGNTLRLWGPSIRAERVVRWHNPDWRGLPIHEADIAAVGVRALLDGGHHGRAYDLTGPERISAREQVRAISAALGEEVRFETVTAAESREILIRQGGWAAASADFLTGFAAYSPAAEIPAHSVEDWDAMLTPLPAVEKITGTAARTYASWAVDHAADFR
jgi:uncharacterized protein YbjT (DUF2867 family)